MSDELNDLILALRDLAKKTYAGPADLINKSADMLEGSQQAQHCNRRCKELAARDGDDQLMQFYAAENLHGLIDAMESHIEKLQSKLPKISETAINFVRA